MDAEWLKHVTILVVDDQEANVVLLKRLLEQHGFNNVRTTTNAHTALEWMRTQLPDIVLLDLMMPNIDGFMVLEELQGFVPEDEYLPVVVLTADTTSNSRRRALHLGARDFLSKPFDSVEVVLRIRNLLQTRWLHVQLQHQNMHLEEQVRQRTLELEQARDEILSRLARTAEYRDDDTGRHTQRVGSMAERIAHKLGLEQQFCQRLGRAALLHDIGKIGIPDRVLLKQGRLTDEEYTLIKTHTQIGGELLSASTFPLLALACEVAMTHHERWDGRGYPNGLRGAAIPLAGRIVAVADTFDALTHARPYKEAWPLEAAVEELRQHAGSQFDPAVVAACLQVLVDDGRLDPDLFAATL